MEEGGGGDCKVQMKEDCHSELSWEHEAGRRVRQAVSFLFLLGDGTRVRGL